MRQGCSPAWVDPQGKCRPLVGASRREAYDEAFLQKTMHACPSLVPAQEFEADFAPLVSLGREIPTDGGPIDNLFISPSGKITLVEAKLWRNPEQTRQVVAQAIDYASSLALLHYEDLEQAAGLALNTTQSLYELVSAAYPSEVPPETDFHDFVEENLRTGHFLVLIVGDGIRTGLERMVGSIHKQPGLHFKFGHVELQVFDAPEAMGGRLLVPQVVLHSREEVRRVVLVDTKGVGVADIAVKFEDADRQGVERKSRTTLSEEEFYARLPDQSSVGIARTLFTRSLDLSDLVLVERKSSSIMVRMRDPGGTKQRLTLYGVTTRGTVFTGWLADQLERIGAGREIAANWIESIGRLVPYDGENDEIPLGTLGPHAGEFIDSLGNTIEAIIESVG